MAELPVLDDAWILERRGPRNPLDPYRPNGLFVEPEYTADGQVEDVATILITNRECPFKCLMCDLWKNTTEQSVPRGAVTQQIETALQELAPAPHVKLYNAGNFFDTQAIHSSELPGIADLLKEKASVVIECHPRLVGRKCFEFADSLAGRLEVAMGLETVDPDVLPRLNKRMTLDDFSAAAKQLVDHGIGVRAFILLRTPFQTETEGVQWAKRSIDFAFENGVECCTIIPTRAGNGAMEDLQAQGLFTPPSVESLESVVRYGLSLNNGRVFADLWDIQKIATTPEESACARRLQEMNLTQKTDHFGKA